MKNQAVEALPGPQESFAALAVALPPHWHRAVLRLAKATERVERRLDEMGLCQDARTFQARMREMATDLIDLLDGLEPDPDLEPTSGDSCTEECEDIDDAEPSLGSLDRRTDQTRWGGGGGSYRDTIDLELDDADDEPSLGWAEEEPAHGRYAGVTPSTVDVEEQCDDEGVTI